MSSFSFNQIVGGRFDGFLFSRNVVYVFFNGKCVIAEKNAVRYTRYLNNYVRSTKSIVDLLRDH